MNCPACCRALAFASLVALSLPGTNAEAGQSEPNAQPKTVAVSLLPAPAAPSAQPEAPSRSAGLSGKVGTPQIQRTPAQQRYGLPKNPMVGPPVDTDLSKPLTLERAIRIGLQQQNAIAIAQAQAEAAKAQLTQARSSYYPQITPSLSYITSLRPGGTVFINGVPFGG